MIERSKKNPYCQILRIQIGHWCISTKSFSSHNPIPTKTPCAWSWHFEPWELVNLSPPSCWSMSLPSEVVEQGSYTFIILKIQDFFHAFSKSISNIQNNTPKKLTGFWVYIIRSYTDNTKKFTQSFSSVGVNRLDMILYRAQFLIFPGFPRDKFRCNSRVFKGFSGLKLKIQNFPGFPGGLRTLY